MPYFYVRYPVSYRDLQEILAERGIAVDHATLKRWVVPPQIAAQVGFKAFHSAAAAIAGIEVAPMIRKAQFNANRSPFQIFAELAA